MEEEAEGAVDDDDDDADVDEDDDDELEAKLLMREEIVASAFCRIGIGLCIMLPLVAAAYG